MLKNQKDSLLFVLSISILFFCSALAASSQTKTSLSSDTPTTPASGGGSSSKTQAEAEKMLQSGVIYKDPDFGSQKKQSEGDSNKTAKSEPENSPTLTETLEWLKGTLASRGTFNFGEGTKYFLEPIAFNEKQFEFFNGYEWDQYFDTSAVLTKKRTRNSFSLSELNPDSLIVIRQNNEINKHVFTTAFILISCRNLKKCIKSITHKENIPGHYDTARKVIRDTPEIEDNEFYLDTVSIELDDEGIANRVMKALRNAIKLSGGKSDPF